MKPTYRKMTVEDYPKVHLLWRRTPGIGLRSKEDSEDGLRKFLERNPNTNFVAEYGNKIVGVMLSGHDGRRCHIYHACVDSDFRGQGVGTELLAMVVDAMKKEDINKIVLVSFKHNNLSNSFWNKNGFEKRDDLNYYGKNI